MDVITIPPFRMVSGQPYSASILFRSKTEGPVDFTQSVHGVAWVGRATFTRETPSHGPCTLLTVSLALKSSGRILMVLAPEQVDLLSGPHVICQINLDAPHPDLNEVWRAKVHILRDQDD